MEVDVCVVGAGIIGLTTAASLLQADPTLTVALLDAREPCAGATGAGQGYIWLAHRAPGSAAWQLATRSKALWAQLLGPHGASQLTLESVEWQSLGSALVAATAAEAADLRAREASLRAAGVDAHFVDAAQLRALEPALRVGDQGAGLLVPGDAQLNGRAAAAAVLAACRAHGARFTPLFHEGCDALLAGPTGRVEGVRTPRRAVAARRGVVLASGAWAGEFLSRELGEAGWGTALRPRKGHLLEMAPPPGMPRLGRGLMEMGYTKHYAAAANNQSAAAAAAPPGPDITFTATRAASGSLLVGSSREFCGWDDVPAPQVVASILARAAEFLPALAAVRPEAVSVRVGLRPFSPVRQTQPRRAQQ
jgi:glycine/D-amino acid oxidase-like deaminating enzyme